LEVIDDHPGDAGDAHHKAQGLEDIDDQHGVLLLVGDGDGARSGLGGSRGLVVHGVASVCGEGWDTGRYYHQSPTGGGGSAVTAPRRCTPLGAPIPYPGDGYERGGSGSGGGAVA